MGERVLRGAPASPGTAVGAARVLAPPAEADSQPLPPELHDAEIDRARRALEAAGEELKSLASRLRAAGRGPEADIIETGVLMASDPGLLQEVDAAVRERGRSATGAILDATAAHADAIAGLDDPLLSERASDVRSLGNRAARLAAGSPDSQLPRAAGAATVLVASDLGPADVAELGPEVVAIALAEGGVRAHAAIVARSLGLPMVVGIGDALLAVAEGEELLVDGGEGFAIASPSSAKTERAALAVARRAAARERSSRLRGLPATTVDGHSVCVLANVASAAEVGVALDAGAEGAGLIRTELAFLDSREWPSEEQHRRALQPILEPLRGHTATVRVLDLGGDKTPPFLAGTHKRGIELLLEAPGALEAQLRAILSFAGTVDLRLLLPLVSHAAQVTAVRDALVRSSPDAGSLPALGAMIETPEAALGARGIAAAADFLSIGTNDLAHSALGLDRFAPGEAPAYHPRVLALIEATVAAARRAGVLTEVCGEAASDPLTVPVLVGLGVDELSAGAARVGAVREWVRALTYGSARELARKCLRARAALEVAAIVRPLARSLESLESGDAAGKSVNGAVRVVTVGPEP